MAAWCWWASAAGDIHYFAAPCVKLRERHLLEGHQLVKAASQSPHVAAVGVWLVEPQLWRHEVRRPNLRLGLTIANQLGNTQVANLSA